MEKIAPVFFDIFKGKPVLQAFSTRRGGVSEGVFSTLNLGINTSDKPVHIKQNRDMFFGYFGLSADDFVFPQQVHGDSVQIVSNPGIAPATDALITTLKGVFLTVQTADCFPVFIYEPIQHTCAIIHSGWRGTAKNITGKTIARMVDDLDCNPANMSVAIGAGIQQKNYQVDKKTADFFPAKYLDPDGDGHFRVDVQGVIIEQVIKCGVPKKQLSADRTCTYEADDMYYSYRRDGQKSGRMMGIIGLL